MSGIFKTHAPLYRAKGFWSRPVIPGEKACKLRSWTRPDFELGLNYVQSWDNKYSTHGIGLLMGNPLPDGTRLGAIDCDRDAYVPLTEALLGGKPPCGRFGSKGAVFFVRVAPGVKNAKFRVGGEKDGELVAEALFNKSLCVIPPTIHPKTKEPYRWLGKAILDIDPLTLPLIGATMGPNTPTSIGLIKAAFESENIPALFGGIETHDSALRLVAQLVRHTSDDNHIIEIVRGALPVDYDGDTLRELPKMIADARAKGFDEPAEDNGQRETIAKAAVELVVNQGIKLFSDMSRRGYLSSSTPEGGRINYALNSRWAELYVQGLYYEHNNRPLPHNSLKEAISALTAKAVFGSPKQETALRVGRDGGVIFIDPGRDDGRVVRIDSHGWTIIYDCPVQFVRREGYGELPLPEKGGDLKALQFMLGLADNAFSLLLAFLILCLRPGPTFMCLLIEGEQGSGKSFLCEVIKRIIDPNAALKLRMPKSEQDLLVVGKATYMLVFDNASGVKSDISDALCVLCTGGGSAARALYTDDDVVILNVMRPFAINGIGEFAHRQDLLDRAILLKLPAMASDNRKTEQELRDSFMALLPGILGQLYDVVAYALANEAGTPTPTDFRMADCAKWISAAAPALGYGADDLLQYMKEVQNELVVDRIANHPLTDKLRALLEEGPVEDYVGAVLRGLGESKDRYFPKTPAHLSKELKRLRAALERVGIFVEFPYNRTNSGMVIRLWLGGQEGFRFIKLSERKPPF